jgi:N-acetylmuramoyl-L-alanine amidase
MPSRLTLLLLALLLPLVAEARRQADETAYEEARRAYYVLKADASRRKLRHHWINVAHKFESVASRYPKSSRAPDALYTAGELFGELSRISFVNEDLQAAISAYTRVAETYPKHRLADDAALVLARIHFERRDQPEQARRVIQAALASQPKGDRVRELKALLASLPLPPQPKAAPVRKGPEPANPVLLEALSKVARESSPQVPEPTATPAPVPEPEVKAVETPAAPVASAEPPKPTPPEPVASAEPSKPAAREPATPEPAQPVTAPVDSHVAEARLKAAARVSKSAELTLAEQLGLKVRRVVIDPGHGGHDTGAIGRKGTREKDVSLAISQKVARELRARGLEVVLTREDDRYLKLEDRAQLANTARGDLFISIHCNSAPHARLRGVETYTLNTSADRYSIRLAARENASSEKGIGDLQFILADLATKANTEESTRLATQVQKSLVTHLASRHKNVKDLGTKEALFYVLLGVRMPAILVETSFLSHPEEEKRLGSDTYQEDVAQAIVHGVEAFLGSRSKLATVQ